MKQKITTKESAIAQVQSGMVLMVGGFGLVGCPLSLVDELYRQGQRDLTIISNNVGEPGRGLSKLLEAGRIRKVIGSYFTSNPKVGERYLAGELEVQLMPQGTFAEAIRAGGAGIGGFYTRASAGTLLEEGKETRVIDGELYVFERPLVADVALIRAHRADRLGNLVYRKTARNFNPVMATAARLVIAEVDEIVEPGALDPEAVVTPHLYVDYIVQTG
ncbi:MAG: CoA transferase subunit A [Alicyclobacillaceae bacterium]|nr:CoA transferase subunit A [Alicyclobacillaceae bacterium]